VEVKQNISESALCALGSKLKFLTHLREEQKKIIEKFNFLYASNDR